MPLWGQDLSFEDLENAPAPVETIGDSSFEDMAIIDSLVDQKESVEKARIRVLRPPPIPQAKLRPNAFRAVIPKGTVLTRLRDDKDFKISRRIQVWAQENYPGSQITHILDKNKAAAFSARSILVVPIEGDLKLTPQINPRITYDKSAGLKYSAFENQLKLTTDINWEFESITPNYWNQVFGQDLESSAATRITLKSFYNDKRLPIKFGLGLSYQNAIATADNFEIRWSALYIGPQISYTLWQQQTWHLDLEAQASAAIISSAKTLNENYSPSSYEWGLAGKIVKKTFLGTFLVAAEYRTTHISLEENTNETSLTPQKDAQTSLALSLGYRLGFNL